MTVTNRTTAARLVKGARILVERNTAGKLVSTRRNAGAFAVIVDGKDVVTVDGGTQRRYVIRTDAGETVPVPGAQTFALADPAPAAVVDAPDVPECGDPVAHVPGVIGCPDTVTGCNGIPVGLSMAGRLLPAYRSDTETGQETIGHAIRSAFAVRHRVAHMRVCQSDPFGRGGVRTWSTVSALVDERNVIVVHYYGRTGPLSGESVFYAVMVDGAVISGVLPGERAPLSVGDQVAREFRYWLADQPAIAPTDVAAPAAEGDGWGDLVDLVEGDQVEGDTATDDDCPGCGASYNQPHGPGCGEDENPIEPFTTLAAWEARIAADDTDGEEDTDGGDGGEPVEPRPVDGPTGGALTSGPTGVDVDGVRVAVTRHVDLVDRSGTSVGPRVVTIRHRAEEGTTVQGLTFDQGYAAGIGDTSGAAGYGALHWQWSAQHPDGAGWVERDSRDKGHNFPRVYTLADRLELSGYAVVRDIDDTPRPAAVAATAPRRMRVGDVVRVAALNDTAGVRRELVDLVAADVTRLGCGCIRVRATRPGPTGSATPDVEVKTGCGFHRADIVPDTTADMLARAETAGREAYALGVETAAPAADPVVMGLVGSRPVGAGSVEIFAAYSAGWQAAADGAARHALLSAEIAETNATVHAEACAANPAAAGEVAAMAEGAASARRNADRVAALAAAPPAGDVVDGPAAETADGADSGPGTVYGAPLDWYTPHLESDDDAELTISHDHETGTTLDGGSKGDGTLEIAKRHRFMWRRFAGVHIPNSRDRFADLVTIDKLAADLRAAGHTVAVDIDDVWRPAAVREEKRAERASARAERLTERAMRQFRESEARRKAADQISDGMPFGEPIKVGHHSERAHRRAFDRIDANTRASIGAWDYAQTLADRAAGAESNEDAKHNPRAIMRRIERLEADARGWARELADPATGDGRRRRATLEVEKLAEDIAHQRATLGDMAAAGAFVAWSRDSLAVGDLVNVSGRWCEVARVNQKGVSVRARFDWETSERVSPIKWDEIYGRRRDGFQVDSPNGEAWPILEAQRVNRWAAICRKAERNVHGHGMTEKDLFEPAHHRRAVRVVLGLAADASDAEVAAYGEPDSVKGKRARALAMLDAYDQFTAGEKFDQVAADVTPIGDTVPTWTMPAGEPVDVMARNLVPGAVIVGTYDRFTWGEASGHGMLSKGLCGPVVSVKGYDRREAGEWVTVTLSTGTVEELRTHRMVSAHMPGTGDQVATADDPADVVDQGAAPAEPAADAPVPAAVGDGEPDALTAAVAGLEAAGYAVGALDLTKAPGARKVPHAPTGAAVICPGDRVDVGWSGGMVDVTGVAAGHVVGTFGDEVARVPLENVRAVVSAGMTADRVHTVTVTNDGRGNMRVHRTGCADIRRYAEDHRQSGGGMWDVKTQDVRGIVLDTYDGFESLAEDGSNWRDFAGDLTVMPCAPDMPDESDGPRALATVTESGGLDTWAAVADLIGGLSV